MKKNHDLMQFKIMVSLFPKQVQVLKLLVIMMLRKFWTTYDKPPLVSVLWEQGFTMHETCIYSIDDHYYSWAMGKASKTTNMYPLLHWITSDSFKSWITVNNNLHVHVFSQHIFVAQSQRKRSIVHHNSPAICHIWILK